MVARTRRLNGAIHELERAAFGELAVLRKHAQPGERVIQYEPHERLTIYVLLGREAIVCISVLRVEAT